MNHPFRVGETYRNEKGEYEVTSINGPRMVVRWTDGSTWEGPVALQARIWERIQLRDNPPPPPPPKPPPNEGGCDFEGLVDGDFQDGVTGTSWRRRGSLGGLLAKQLSDTTPKDFESHSVPRQPAVHVARVGYYEREIKWRQPKFVLALDEAKATYGFYIEKSDEPMDDTWHWPKFLAALEGGPALSQKIDAAMEKHALEWQVFLPRDSGIAARVVLSGSKLIWTPQPEGEPVEMLWQDFFERLRAIPPDQYCDLYLATDMPKADAIAAKRGLADKVVAVYRALLPLYDASTGRGR